MTMLQSSQLPQLEARIPETLQQEWEEIKNSGGKRVSLL